MAFEIHAYCLMSNHVHLLLEKQLGDISIIMKRLLTKYAMYFNRQYDRCGTLISNRYKSIPVEVDEYFIPLVSYIHQNPVRAGLVKKLEEYSFSSFIDYVRGGGLTDTDFTLNLLGKNEWLRLHQVIQNDTIDTVDKMKLSEEEIRRKILQYTGGRDPHEIISWSK
ncbi:transposase [Pelosinus baikalensis]|uniref:Transposase n=1 Tax=Pelosinus baikalensis TaxID=2892015 RepID=A0ABS8HZ88_9FIRM|nr:transposase [Pelosinus baikalensis]MCC5468481.1 transposase [Pelosinus baikalensis]